jgi:hypothetical protein
MSDNAEDLFKITIKWLSIESSEQNVQNIYEIFVFKTKL